MGQPLRSAGLDVAISASSDGVVLKFDGCVDENARFEDLSVPAEASLVFDLGEVKLINSLGIRGWVGWMKTMRDRTFVFRRCSRAIIDQISVLDGFLPPRSHVESFFVPYHCDPCDREERILFRHGVEFEKGTADRPERVTPPTKTVCADCGKTMEMDVIETKYFRFLKYRR